MAEPFCKPTADAHPDDVSRPLGDFWCSAGVCLLSAPALSLKSCGSIQAITKWTDSGCQRQGPELKDVGGGVIASRVNGNSSLRLPFALGWWRQVPQFFFKSRDERSKWFIERIAEAPQFNDVDPALAAFRLTYIRLRLTKAFCKLNLGHSVRRANVAQDRKERLVLPRMDGLAHGSQALGQPWTLETILE